MSIQWTLKQPRVHEDQWRGIAAGDLLPLCLLTSCKPVSILSRGIRNCLWLDQLKRCFRVKIIFNFLNEHLVDNSIHFQLSMEITLDYTDLKSCLEFQWHVFLLWTKEEWFFNISYASRWHSVIPLRENPLRTFTKSSLLTNGACISLSTDTLPPRMWTDIQDSEHIEVFCSAERFLLQSY